MRELADQNKARLLQSFFKTGPGQYGEGDVFLGITVPVLRKLARKCRDTGLPETLRLLRSSIHEERLLALLLLIQAFSLGDPPDQDTIYEAYLRNSRYVNNWDLVDLSSPYIVGQHLFDKRRDPLYELARSENLWQRRISIVATLHFIRRNDFSDTLGLSKVLLRDKHDLIHKAVGWMLREVGKRDSAVERDFLREHYRQMPRTMLRYAIERFPEPVRKKYLKGTV